MKTKSASSNNLKRNFVHDQVTSPPLRPASVRFKSDRYQPAKAELAIKRIRKAAVPFQMADTVTPAVRSRMMASIRDRNTQPEMIVRKAVWRSGFRYRLHSKKLPGKPDLTFANYRLAVFVHGCFWHQHGCTRSKRPSSNRGFWEPKLDRNKQRDEENQVKLGDDGWTVLVIWECEIEEGIARLLAFLDTRRK